MQQFTYLLINIATIFICFFASFDRRIPFYKHFRTFLLSSTVVAVPFILWDVYFTHTGVWWFNTDYTLGFSIFGLPFEELLFFWCIPFSCVFTYYCIVKYYPMRWTQGWNTVWVFSVTIFLSVIGLLFFDKIYTLVTVIVTLVTLLYLYFIAKIDWLFKATVVYFFLLPGFFGVNGILTGSIIDHAVVNYNPKDFIGFRLGTIPIEDMVYGYAMILWNIYLFKFWQRKDIML